MATETSHIALANRNHAALCVLLNTTDEHPEWVATIAFYKALQIVEAVFATTGIGHGCGHSKRLEILQNRRHGFSNFCKHYEALLEASEVARYLGARTTPGVGYSSFSSYMSMEDVRADLLRKRLKNVEMHARQYLTASAKSDLRPIESALASQ